MFSSFDARKTASLVGFFGVLGLTFGSGCGSAQPSCGSSIEARVRPGVDFRDYRTFAIKNPIVSKLEGGEDSDLPSTVEVHLKKANMEAALALEAGGLEEVDPGKDSPHLWIASGAATKVEDGATWDCVSSWKWWGWEPSFDACPWVEPIPVEYSAGTLVISVVDAKTNEVVFGGLAPEMLECTGDVTGSIESAVDQIFLDYPFDE